MRIRVNNATQDKDKLNFVVLITNRLAKKIMARTEENTTAFTIQVLPKISDKCTMAADSMSVNPIPKKKKWALSLAEEYDLRRKIKIRQITMNTTPRIVKVKSLVFILPRNIRKTQVSCNICFPTTSEIHI